MNLRENPVFDLDFRSEKNSKVLDNMQSYLKGVNLHSYGVNLAVMA